MTGNGFPMANLDFIVAKVRGMRGKLYEGERLYKLCTSPGIEDLAAVLAPGQAVGDASRLEQRLTAAPIGSLHRILTALRSSEADLFLWLLRRYQVENLKVLLRCWAAKSPYPVLSAYSVDLPEPLALPSRSLMESSSLEALIERIPVPQYREGALLGLGEFEESGRLFFVEVGIDRTYFAELDARVQHIRGVARAAAAELVGLELDAYNVMLTLRAVFNYLVPFNKIRQFLAPFGGHAGLSVLDQLRKAPDIRAAATAVPQTLLGRQEILNAEMLETAMWRNLYLKANRWYYRSVLDFGAVVAFYYIKRVELANLIQLSEHIRSGERGDAIRSKLIGPPSEEVLRTG